MRLSRCTVLLAAALPLLACSSLPASNPGAKSIIFDLANKQTVRIIHASAVHKSAETVIRGEVAFPVSVQNGFFTGTINGRIDIPGQPPFRVRKIEVHREPIPKVTGRRGFFTIHTGRSLPPGSIVHLAYRDV